MQEQKGIPGQVAQGDLLFTPVAALPKDQRPKGKLTPRPAINGAMVLAMGEVTGHTHAVRGGSSTLAVDEGGVMWLTVEELTEVKHPEHEPAILTPEHRTYRVDRQQEMGWTGWRQVTD